MQIIRLTKSIYLACKQPTYNYSNLSNNYCYSKIKLIFLSALCYIQCLCMYHALSPDSM